MSQDRPGVLTQELVYVCSTTVDSYNNSSSLQLERKNNSQSLI